MDGPIDLTATYTWMSAQGYFGDELGKFDVCKTGSDPKKLGDANAGYLNRKMCFAKLIPKQTLKRKNVSDISDEVEIKKTKEGDDFDEMSRKRKIAESKEDGNTAKKLKGD